MTSSSISRPTAIRSSPVAGTVPRRRALMILILSSRSRFIGSGSGVFIDLPILPDTFLLDQVNTFFCCFLHQPVHDSHNPAGGKQGTEFHLGCFPVRAEERDDLLLLLVKTELVRHGWCRCSRLPVCPRGVHDRAVGNRFFLARMDEPEEVPGLDHRGMGGHYVDPAE